MAKQKMLSRKSVFEVFEARTLMAADLALASPVPPSDPQSDINWSLTNLPATRVATPVYLRATAETQSSDLNLDGLINHRDAHTVISFLNTRSRTLSDAGQTELQSLLTSEGEGFSNAETLAKEAAEFDANGDGEVGPMDLLWIVNQIKEYDPLTPCDCGVCSRPILEGRCENASLAQAQAANLATITLAADIHTDTDFAAQSLASLGAAQSIDELLRSRRN